MGAQEDQVRQLADRIARQVAGAAGSHEYVPTGESSSLPGNDLAALRSGLAQIERRLARIESKISFESDAASGELHAGSTRPGGHSSISDQQRSVTSPWLSGVYVPAAHPSVDKFGVEEAAVAELVDYFQGEKRCEMEPGGKPCDHCSMCSSRGF